MVFLSLSEEHDTNSVYVQIDENMNYKQYEFMKIIESSLNITTKKKYLISITGLQNTIENLLEDMKSSDYIILRGNNKRFFKKFPELVLITENEEDLETVFSYAESFNEGSLIIYIVDANNNSITTSQFDKEEVEKYLNKYGILSISVVSDGKVLELENCSSNKNLVKICMSLCKKFIHE